ncbi:fibronectin type III domain-containing protein, partial [Patescibacteria group bacterium]|nr:fibronectin type III domain-containing protein [Patescibacteria group bacterium]
MNSRNKRLRLGISLIIIGIIAIAATGFVLYQTKLAQNDIEGSTQVAAVAASIPTKPTPVMISNLATPVVSRYSNDYQSTLNPVVRIVWQDNSQNETGFIVSRSENNSTWMVASQTGANVTAISDSSLVAGKTYYYRIQAYNPTGSNVSETVSITTAAQSMTSVPLQPTSLKAVYVNGKVQITWQDNSFNESSFWVMRSETGNGLDWIIADKSPANSGSYTDTSAIAGKFYYYRVRANTVSSGLIWSNVATVLVGTAPTPTPTP